ncbi:hypothetical protein OIU76_000965 [Salix suchowensis]|nr:hypothetical protein OIU76_000965 [Salix suchowensis]KAJ6387501.1 hypothetical protein OIU78_017260 [Salix suchowensis]
MPKSQQTYIFFVGWVSMWFCFCINLDFWTGCCFKTQFLSIEHPHKFGKLHLSVFFFCLPVSCLMESMDRRRRRRRQAKINISESEEVSSIEWEFINMSEQEEDLIYRMYRLVGERYVYSESLATFTMTLPFLVSISVSYLFFEGGLCRTKPPLKLL